MPPKLIVYVKKGHLIRPPGTGLVEEDNEVAPPSGCNLASRLAKSDDSWQMLTFE